MDQLEKDSLYLEGNIPEASREILKAACTSSWGDTSNLPDSAFDAVLFQRHDNTIRYAVPWINRFLSFEDTHLIDFGCGCGSSSLAFSHFFKSVEGFEIDQPSVDAFKVRMKLFGRGNVSIHQSTPDLIVSDSLDLIQDDTCVVLLAVVEHLTEREQVEYLSAFWDKLLPGQYLFILETPNMYSLMDTHTFSQPLMNFVPDEIFLDYIKMEKNKDLRFRDDFLNEASTNGEAAVLEKRRRYGLGVSHHVFELAFGEDLQEIVVGDGFSPEIVEWFPMSPDDRFLLSTFDEYNIDLPIGFARSVLSFAFQKPKSVKHANEVKTINAVWRDAVLLKYGRTSLP